MRYLITLLFFASTFFIYAQDSKDILEEKMKTETFSGLKLRSIGPGLTSGRIVHLAVKPNDRTHFYVGVAAGHVWKTTNGGISFKPVFDNQDVYSIGVVEMNPHNYHEVWVGTGENNSQRSVSWGNGIYKSLNGGESWEHMGLDSSGHIGRILFDPDNPNTIYVAAYGWLWGPGGHRGVFKSTDGGKTWDNSLFISENTGVSDLVMDPRDPNTMYAAAYQRRRHVWTLINGGPEAGIYKTIDGGENWFKINSGLPSVDMGRIGLAISPQDPDVIYALVEAAEGKDGFFKSTNRGASWKKQSDYKSSSPQYYQEIVCDPVQFDYIYSLSTYSMYSDDGGKTWNRLSNDERHVDDHALYIDPNDNNYVLIGGDGGLYESHDRGKEWRFFPNLPLVQFYRIQADNAEPFYNVYGGTQDNNSIGGPSRTTHANGILNQDWFYVLWGDGYEPQIDPENPNIVYAQWQYGNLVRFDRQSGEFAGIKPQEEEGEELRWNWDSPVIISPHDNKRLYFAANKVFRSDDQGNSWQKISGDLSRQINRNELKVMGKVWPPEAVSKNQSTSLYGNIVSLAESPVKEGLLWVGTDDGLIHYTEDNGANWTKIEKINGAPEKIYVADLYPSRHDENVIYAIYNNHKMNDFKPYIYRSDDKGKSWKTITNGIPNNEPAWTIEEDTEDPNLIFAGTEFGLYFSNDAGQKWIELKSGFPTNSVRDLDIQERENDLVVGTFGRGIYILDDYTPLRYLKKENLAKDAHIFPIKDALMYIESRSRSRRNEGESFYRADNPEFGAIFTYYIKEKPKTLKAKRNEAWKKSEANGRTPSYPTWDELTKEDEEIKPYLLFTVSDMQGNKIRDLKASYSPGINRIAWDLRYPSQDPLSKSTDPNKHSGAPVVPGEYQVTLSEVVDGKVKQLDGPVMFTTKPLNNVTLPAMDKQALADFMNQVSDIQGDISAANKMLANAKNKVDIIENTISVTENSDAKLLEKVYDIKYQLNEIQKRLTGNNSISNRAGNQTPSLQDRVGYIALTMWYTTSKPTQTNIDSYNIAKKQYDSIVSDMKNIMETQIAELESQLESLNAPWTPNR